jgi:signal transduction histidine kinase
MQLRLKNAIRKSYRIRFLSAVTFALSILSLALYFPDIFQSYANAADYTEPLHHGYIHIILSCALAAMSWFSFHSHQMQKQIFSIIESLPHSILIFSSDGKLMTANLSGSSFIKNEYGTDYITYKKFIEYICLKNIQQKDQFHHMNNPLFTGIKTQKAIFQDIYKSDNKYTYLIQCQEISANLKFVLITNVTQIYDLNKESHTLLTAVNLSPTGFALASRIDDQYHVFYFNNAYQVLLGIEHSDNNLAKHIITISTLDEWKNTDKAIHNGMPYQFEGKLEENYETTRYLSCQLFPVQQNKHDIILIYINDITEQKIRDHQSQQSIRLETIGHLSSGIAHDFNNILSIIKGYQQLSMKDGLDRKTFLEYNHHIEIAIQRASLLTKQLLSFGDNKIILKGKTDFISQMKQLETLLLTLIHSAAKLEFLIPHDLQVRLACPVDIFTQIIMNLVINSRDALPRGGTISVSAHIINTSEQEQLPPHLRKSEQTFLCIQVHDDGTGIKPEHIPHIFDPFFTTKDVNKGTGLGLSLIYKHLKNLNGYIKASSIYGEGTTMSVYLPIDQNAETDSYQVPQIYTDISILKNKKIILAEDENDIRFILSTTLKEWGCDVFEAADGHSALSIQDEMDHVDILLTDIMMPNINGIYLAHMFEQLRPETKIIFLTGYPKLDAHLHLDIPANSMSLTKPISNEALQNALLSTLTHR